MIRFIFSLASGLAALFIISLTLGACAPPFPKETLDKVNRGIVFKDLQKDPDGFKGAWVVLGGVIVSTRNTKEGTFIEVMQKPLDSDTRPLQTDATDGRFLVRTETFLDIAVYHPGRLITVIAEVVGRREQQLDEIVYQYPLCDAKDLHLWNPSTGPRFYFGVGIMHRL